MHAHPLRAAAATRDLSEATAAPDGVASIASPSSLLHAASAEELVGRAAAGGEEGGRAFAVLVERFHPRALRFARNLGLGREDAEEAVQDTFVRVHRALPRFREGARFEPWLLRILANRCRSTHARTRTWRQGAVDAEVLDALPGGGAGQGDGEAERLVTRVDARVEAEGERARIARALATLPREQREAFLLRHVEELDYEDMMRATGAGLSALKMRVKRACDALRARLAAEERV